MKIKGFYYDGVFISCIGAAAFVFSAVVAVKYDKMLALVMVVIFAIIFLYGLIRTISAHNRYKSMLKTTAKKLDYSNTNLLSDLTYPVCVSDDNGFITWANELFISEISKNDINKSTNISKYLGVSFDKSLNLSVKFNEKFYLVHFIRFINHGERFTIYKFFDNTELKQIEELYIDNFPFVALIEIDNLDDSRSSFKDSEISEIRSNIESLLDNWCERFETVSKHLDNDRYFIVTEQKNINKMIEDKFSILESVRSCTYRDKKLDITISIGVSKGENLKQAQQFAKEALEVSLSRGGDQVAIRNEDSYTYFGGVSKSAEKKHRVQTRIWAEKLYEHINESSNVIICGHINSDFDSVGSAFGLAYAIRKLDKNVNVIYDKQNTLSENLFKVMIENGYDSYLVSKNRVDSLVQEKTLFILIDTHNINFCELKSLVNESENLVIIDHHRLDTTTKSNPILFIHNPGSSSACEMVAELLQYLIPHDKIPTEIAGALFAGIMLDTKNFIVGTGVRTFEAAAYLRDRGADTFKVKRLFSTSFEDAMLKNEIICQSENYKQCSISVTDISVKNIRIIASQAADELLTSSDVKATFVIFKDNDNVCISSRSYGEINVQIIMEALGGGGHQNMAACQIPNTDINEVRNMLIGQIDNYFS